MAKLIGNAPNQVPTNADLGSMAFEDRTNYITKGASVYQPYRNLIINGDMSIAQRGTSASGITTGGTGTVHSVDRMALAISGAGTWTVSQETDVPSGQGFAKSLKFLCTTNQPSIGAGGYITFLQKFEGQNLQYLKFGTSNAQSLTASFWIKSSKTGNIIVELADRDNGKYIGQLVSIDTANTWEKKTVTFQGNTVNSFNNDNLQSMDLQLWFGAGTSLTSGTYSGVWQSASSSRASGLDLQLQDTTNANVYLTGVQLEAGTTASDFEFLPYDVNLQRCYRYYQNLDIGQLGFGFSTANGQWMYVNVGLSTVMRANPTATQGSTSAVGSTNAIGVGVTRPQQILYQLQASGSGSDIYAFGTSAQITLDAEL